MSLEKIKTTNKDNFLNPLPDEVEKFKEIFEDFERKVFIQYGLNIWNEAKFFIDKNFVWYFLYEIKNWILQLNEIASSNMSELDKKFAREKFIWDYMQFSTKKVPYIWIFMMKKLVDLTKQNNINQIKISGVLDSSAGFYKKVADLFIKMWIIKSTSWIKIEKEDFWPHYSDWRKNIYWYLEK